MAATVSRREQYVGEKHKSLREGSGTYEYGNKFFKYEGQWKNGKKHGTGKLMFMDGSYYEGTFQNGEIEGFGTRYFAKSGCKYQGQFRKGELHGKGRMVWPDGSIYEGLWESNRRKGFGIMKSSSENLLYKGNYVDNKREGHGTMIYPTGDRYEGGWESGLRHGEGDMKFVDGTVYEGMFENDAFNGVGVMRHCSGLVYHGNWQDGKPTLLPSRLVIVNETEKDVLEFVLGQPFNISVKCVNQNGDLMEVDSGRELRITAGFKHAKAKKGTALFDLIEEYEEKPMETPYYEVLQYPLTDFVVEEEPVNEEKEEEQDDIAESEITMAQTRKGRRRSTAASIFSYCDQEELGLEPAVPEEQNESSTEAVTEDPSRPVTQAPGDQSEDQTPAPGTESRLERQGSLASIPDTNANGSAVDGSVLEKESRPLPPPVANKRTCKGVCEWQSITLAQAPPRFPPFVVLDEEQKKILARQNKQVEAKRTARVAHDERYARVGEYVLMVHDVTSPPFMDQTLEPAYILVRLNRPKREKKPKPAKPKQFMHLTIQQPSLKEED